jgi:hypothetical protein
MAGVEGERELEDFLTDVFEGKEPKGAEEPEVVHDEPPGYEPPAKEVELPTAEEGEEGEEPEEAEEGEEELDPALAWAKKKYGEDADKWARAAYQQEQYISKLAAEKKQAEDFAKQMADYAQFAESQATDQMHSGLPLSAQEEAWIEQGLVDPLNYAYTALLSGNVQLYNGLIGRIAEEQDPTMAANVGAQAQIAVQQAQAAQQVQAAQQEAYQGDFPARLDESVKRVGIDREVYGEQMAEKIAELGEYDPYVQTIMHSQDPNQRDLALRAVYDLVRAGQAATRRVRETDREAQIRRESELRREAASVVTGSPHVELKKESPFMEAMREEWRRAGQWQDEES